MAEIRQAMPLPASNEGVWEGRHRTHVWQWIRAGQTRMRTLIDEHEVSDSWAGC